jgi:hypothetical protein
VQIIRFNLASAVEWCDPSSVIVSFVVKNDAANPLHPATVGAHCLFDRLQVRISSAQIEDIEHYGRLTEQFSRLLPAEKRLNNGVLGFGTLQTTTANMFLEGAHAVKEIPAGAVGKRVFMKLDLSGVFTANQKYLPLWAMGAGGVEVLLSLAPAAEAMVANFGATVKSQAYHLEDIRMEADFITIDSSLQEQYSRNLLEGGSLTLHTNLWDCTQVYLPPANAGNFDVSLRKSLSRAATVFFSFSEEIPAADILTGTMYCNTFWSVAGAAENIESWVTVGSKKYPEYPVTGSTAHFWRLLNALGIAKSLPHTVNVDLDSYNTRSFTIGCDLEACPLGSSSGVNTTGGQEIALHVKKMTNAAGTAVPRRCWAAIHYEAIVELRATGAHLLT